MGGLLAGAGAITIAIGVGIAPATAAAPGELDGFEYVALGDSYQAGFGLTPFSTTSPFAGDPNGCYQADSPTEGDYPRRVTTDLGLALSDQTCSGAVTANLGYPQPTTTLPVPPVSLETFPTLSGTEAKQVTMDGVTAPTFQNEALSDSTDIVTVGIGGNDLGFTDIAESCMRLAVGPGTKATGMEALTSISVDNCKDVFESDAPEYAEYQISTRLTDYIEPRIEAVFQAIDEQAPNAQVFVVGYPQLAPETATDACFKLTSPPSDDNVPFSGVDMMYLHQVEKALVDIVRARAAAHGFHFVDAWPSTAGHTLCDGAESWIEPLDVAFPTGSVCPTDYMPLGKDGTTYICVKLGALHPTTAGVENLHQLVKASVEHAFYVRVHGDASPGSTITVEGGGFAPGETVDVVLHSTPVTIGTPTADARGSFSAAMTIPGDVPAGSHTVVATGAASGRAFSAGVVLALPATGSGLDAAAPTAIGGALLLLGIALLAIRRRGATRRG